MSLTQVKQKTTCESIREGICLDLELLASRTNYLRLPWGFPKFLKFAVF